MAKTKKKTPAKVQTTVGKDVSDRPIPLMDPDRWTVRVVDNDTEVDKARVNELITAGWQYLDPDDLAVRANEIGFKVMNSHVVRGDHGEEVLLKILTVDVAAFEEAEKTRVKPSEQEDRGLRKATRSLEKSEIAEREAKAAKKPAKVRKAKAAKPAKARKAVTVKRSKKKADVYATP